MQDNAMQIKRNRRKRRNENTVLIGSIILCIITLCSITVCMIMVVKYRSIQLENVAVINELDTIRMEQEATYTQGEMEALVSKAVDDAVKQTGERMQDEYLGTIKDFMISGQGTMPMLRYFFPNDVVLTDNGEYYFFPISPDLKKHTYDLNNLQKDENGVMNYYANGNIISHKGIDVSRYQDEIDWEKVAEDQIEYAFIRVGIRGYSKGEIVADDSFKENIEGALRNNIDVGVYFFTQATSVEEAEEEAKFVLDAIEPYNVKYPVVLDVEKVDNKKARAGELTKEERTQYCIAFCETIKKAGYTPMIYGNIKTFMLMLDMEQLEEYEKWYAFYDDNVYFPYAFKIWQYTDSGKVNGIKGDVDLNISFGDWANE